MNARVQMIAQIAEKYGLTSSEVFSVMLQIPREEFIPQEYRKIAYDDGPVPIGYGQTMSQPYTVAFMTHLLELTGKEKVLEIGTGSGYQAAVLSKLAEEVFTIEIVPELAKKAKEVLSGLGYDNVHVKVGSGEYGWPRYAPYDRIIVTAGIDEKVPDLLFRQLKAGGLMVAPVGKGINKVMTRFVKKRKGEKEVIKREEFGIFRFVPFVVQ